MPAEQPRWMASRHPGRLPRKTVIRALLTQRSPKGERHPKVLDRGRALVANLRFSELVAVFLAIFVLLGLLAGALLDLTEPAGRQRSFAYWTHQALMGLSGAPQENLSAESADDARKAAQAGIAVLSVLLPGLFLGAIVFRLFVRDRTLVFRRRPSLVLRNPLEGGEQRWSLVLRLYPATYVLLLDLDFSVFLQQAKEVGSGFVLLNTPLRVVNPTWPVGDTHSPFSLILDLDEGDVDQDAEEPRLVSVQGCKVDATSQLIVHAVGHAPELGSDFSEHHRIQLPSPLVRGGYHGVRVLYDGRGPSWRGWDRFEEEEETVAAVEGEEERTAGG